MQQHWFKLSIRFWDDSKVLDLRASLSPLRFYRAAALFQVLLGMHAENEGDGALSVRRHVLAHRLGEPLEAIDDALADLDGGKFIERKGGRGPIALVGWQNYWGKLSPSAFRMRRKRARDREQETKT